MSDVSNAQDPAAAAAPALTPAVTPPLAQAERLPIWKATWDYLDILKALALIVIVSYIGIVASGHTADETHKNMALMCMAFYFGSSLGSKNKDQKLNPTG